jgi:CheY-like chemotaxis protein
MKGAILIVDDDADSRELLAELLTNEGYHSIMAANAPAALRRLQSVRPDLIITDFAMPEMNGAQFLAMLALTPVADVPAIVITGTEHADVTRQLQQVGARVACVLGKPLDLAALLVTVERVLGESALRAKRAE